MSCAPWFGTPSLGTSGRVLEPRDPDRQAADRRFVRTTQALSAHRMLVHAIHDLTPRGERIPASADSWSCAATKTVAPV
jgi:hypothetical protein